MFIILSTRFCFFINKIEFLPIKKNKKKENHNKEEEKIRDGGIACAMHADLLPLQQFIQNSVCVYI